MGKGIQRSGGRSNSAVRSSNGSVHSARSREGNGVNYYNNVDRLRSVNKLTTIDNHYNQSM